MLHVTFEGLFKSSTFVYALICMYVCMYVYACKYFVCIYCIWYVCMCVCISFMYVCFVFALVRKNSIVQAPEVKPLINQSINQSHVRCRQQ